MPFEKKLKVHRSFMHLTAEEDLFQCDCISLVDNGIEQQIFLSKAEDGFEVRVYKANPSDTYVPNTLDFKVKKYEANDLFASFFFDTFFFARRFITLLEQLHPEYNLRPVSKS